MGYACSSPHGYIGNNVDNTVDDTDGQLVNKDAADPMELMDIVCADAHDALGDYDNSDIGSPLATASVVKRSVLFKASPVKCGRGRGTKILYTVSPSKCSVGAPAQLTPSYNLSGVSSSSHTHVTVLGKRQATSKGASGDVTEPVHKRSCTQIWRNAVKCTLSDQARAEPQIVVSGSAGKSKSPAQHTPTPQNISSKAIQRSKSYSQVTQTPENIISKSTLRSKSPAQVTQMPPTTSSKAARMSKSPAQVAQTPPTTSSKAAQRSKSSAQSTVTQMIQSVSSNSTLRSKSHDAQVTPRPKNVSSKSTRSLKSPAQITSAYDTASEDSSYIPSDDSISEPYSSESECDHIPECLAGNKSSETSAEDQWFVPCGKHKLVTLSCRNEPVNNDMPTDGNDPFTCYSRFVDDEVIEWMVLETNRYASQTLRDKSMVGPESRILKWVDTDAVEMRHFIGLVLWMGLVKMPSMDCYWRTSAMYKNAIASTTMTRNRFQLLLRMWHFANNDDALEDDRTHKVNGFVELLLLKFATARTPGENIVIDESMVPFRGRLKFKQYLPGKSHKYGIKIFKLCDSQGYTYNLSLYTKKGNYALSLPSDVILNLCGPYLQCGRTQFLYEFAARK